MPNFDLDKYETVDTRVHKFWKDHADGRILTELVSQTEREFIVIASVYRDAADERPAATGFAQEVIGSSPVNKTSALENCETSAIGRALANLGYATKGQRPSREEMQKAQRQPSTPDLMSPSQVRAAILKAGTARGMDKDAIADDFAGFAEGLAITNADAESLSKYLTHLTGAAA